MSKTTLRKRISLTVVTALTAGFLSVVVTAPVANAGPHLTAIGTGEANTATAEGTPNNSLFVATKLSTTGAATNILGASGTGLAAATSLGLLVKDASSGTAQTATMLTSGSLALYFPTSTATTIAFVATGGTFATSPAATGVTAASTEYSQTRNSILVVSTAATTSGVTWTAPSSAGTYTVSMYNSASGTPTIISPAKTLAGQISVTVVAASAGGSYSAAKSFCAIANSGAVANLTSNTDTVAATINGGSMWINFALNDAYDNNLAQGNIVATATNGALIAFGDGVTGTTVPAAGTASTVVAYDTGAGDSIRVNQGTADAPLSTTVTITYNGTTVCTKTVGFAGAPTKVAVTVLETQKLSGTEGKDNFLEDGYDRDGQFTVLLTDAAGNQVQAAAGDNGTTTIGTFSANAASLAGQTIVSALSVTSPATQTSTTLPGRLSTGKYECGANAGEVKTAKLDFTITATGKVITSDAFTLRCAGAPYSYTASFDKASYVQGDLATLTVKFLDSKGNAANSMESTGTWTSVTPMLTTVSATGAAAGLGTTGSKKYTYTVGTASGMTAGTYTSIIDFTVLTDAGTADKATPTYKLSTGGDTTTNADVLKSIVALIASINKQIQALQKLILRR
jgi:hypothetical protein